MNSIPSFEAWRAAREYDRSFDRYRYEFPEVKEYQVFRLDPTKKMCHIEEAPLLETNCLAEAHGFIYDAFKKDGSELCIYQRRSNGYAGFYRHSNKHSKRDAAGRFTKA